jgi:hypothetical protein
MNNQTIEINGIPCYTTKQFSKLVKRSEHTIRYLFHNGNKIRKLKGVKLDRMIMIHASEVTEFPFTDGRLGDPYHYTESGEKVFA